VLLWWMGKNDDDRRETISIDECLPAQVRDAEERKISRRRRVASLETSFTFKDSLRDGCPCERRAQSATVSCQKFWLPRFSAQHKHVAAITNT
jgi:hypothetical protein